MGTLHKDVFSFMTVMFWIFLRMRNVSNRSSREIQNNTFYVQWLFFWKLCCLWECWKIWWSWRLHMAIWWCIAYWISITTLAQAHTSAHVCAHAHTQIHTTYAFPWRQWFCERVSMLWCTYFVWFVLSYVSYCWSLCYSCIVYVGCIYFVHLGISRDLIVLDLVY